MSTWHAELTRNGDGTVTATTPEDGPEWVTDLISDVTYGFRESPSAHTIAVTVEGDDQPDSQETPDAAPGPAAGGIPPGAVVSTGPGTPPPDADQP